MDAIRIVHPLYGPGFFHRLLPEPGHARAQFDGTTDFVSGERRVLIRDLAPETMRESAAEVDRSISDMMGRAVTRCLREVRS